LDASGANPLKLLGALEQWVVGTSNFGLAFKGVLTGTVGGGMDALTNDKAITDELNTPYSGVSQPKNAPYKGISLKAGPGIDATVMNLKIPDIARPTSPVRRCRRIPPRTGCSSPSTSAASTCSSGRTTPAPEKTPPMTRRPARRKT
jgi:hypothetical protein